MEKSLWQSPRDREKLLKDLVKRPTITGSRGELSFPSFIRQLLLEIPYFELHKNHVQLTSTEDYKELVTAFYQAPNSSKTIVLISHFDTVGVEDYSTIKENAFDPDYLKKFFEKDNSYLDKNAIEDLKSDNYIFGRGIMDMKAGLMLHLGLIEKATIEKWDVNLILVTVPDEEVNSSGARKAVETIERIKQTHQLDIQLHLNSEPTFQQSEIDHKHYVYSGSIGKIMPGVLCYGKETHVGNPLDGLSSNYMMSYITQFIEYNDIFKETFENEETPLPVSLMTKDIKEDYDVQTPFKTVSLYNMFLFNRSSNKLYDLFTNTITEAVSHCENSWSNILKDSDQNANINVLTFEELKNYTINKYGEQFINNLIDDVLVTTTDLNLQSVKVTEALMDLCKNLTPAVVTFLATPYYPSVNDSYTPFIESIVDTVQTTLKNKFHRNSERIHYFNGISDSSYFKFNGNIDDLNSYKKNTPNFNITYKIPFESIKKITAPVLLCGPIGKDAHKVTERLNKKSAFEELPSLLETIITKHFID